MLWTIAVILLSCGLLGLSAHTRWADSIHVLLVLAIVVFLIQVIQGRRVG